jgi:hypothetical protein
MLEYYKIDLCENQIFSDRNPFLNVPLLNFTGNPSSDPAIAALVEGFR